MRLLFTFLVLAISFIASAQNPVFVLNPTGHSARIQAILTTPDQKIIITLGGDKAICIWDAATGQLLRKKWLDLGPGDNGRFIDADIGQRSGMVAVARINSEGKPVVTLFDVVRDRTIGTIEGFSHELGFMRIDPNERFLITGMRTSTNAYAEPLRLWEIPGSSTKPFRISKATAQLDGVSIHDGSFYNNGNDFVFNAAMGENGSIHINHDPSAIPEFSWSKQPLTIKNPGHVAFSLPSDRLFVAGHGGEVTLVSGLKTEVLLPRRKRWGNIEADSSVHAATINRPGTLAVLTGTRHTTGDFIEVYDLVRKRKIATIAGWHQSVSFVSDTTFGYEGDAGFCIRNVLTGRMRVVQGPRASVADQIGYGAGNKILFDSSRRVFDFQNLELLEVSSKPEGFSRAKMSFHDQRITGVVDNGLLIDRRFRMLFPHETPFNSVTYLNDGRVAVGRTVYRSFASHLFLYDLNQVVDKDVSEAESLFEGNFGSVISIAPHPDLESTLFGARDRAGTIALFDPTSSSAEAYRFRYWPFVNLNMKVKGKRSGVYMSPQAGYRGSLKEGDRLESINGFRVTSTEAITRHLETLDPHAPLDIVAQRGSQKIHSIEKLATVAIRPQLLSFIPLENNEWVCWTPQGYYAASANGERSAGWVINKDVNGFAEFHPIYDFKKQFYKPELIKLIATHSSLEKGIREYNKTAAQPLSLSAEIGEKLPPSITWVSPSRDTTLNTRTVRFVASVQSSSKLQSAKILLNGRTILRRDQVSIRQDRESPVYSVSFELDLVATDNIINIFAENEFGTTISAERVLKMEAGETGIERYKPNLYVLSVGISRHSNPNYALSYADKDARSIDELYRLQQGSLFRNVFTRTLVNEEATRTGILESFYWLEQNATQKDVVVIFMASHGLNDKDKFYILPYDGDPERIKITGVDWSNFADVLGNLPSKVLVFVDACHSGRLGTNILTKRGDTDLVEAIRQLATEENGVVIMAASTGKESSLESAEWQHGAFTLALLEGLGEAKADINGDNVVNIREIDYYVAERVKALTNGRQHPTTQKPSVVSEFPLVMRR